MAASWECPSLPMLSFPLKESVPATFLPLKPLISAHYEENADSFAEEIKQLDSLRQTALQPSKDHNGVSVLRRYFGQLHLIRERFPPETAGQLPIDFVWKDAFTDAQYVNEGVMIEQASILYNISALHSMLACRVKRTNEQDMKEAVTHFQIAAGAYSYLEEHLAGRQGSKDLGPQFVALYKDLILGQAQECVVEKSLKGDGRVKHLAIAKLAIRVSEYYMNVSRLLDGEPCRVIVKRHKDWPKLLRMKTYYFQAVSHFYQGCHAEEQGRQGETIAWLQLALGKLTAIGKIPKSLGELREAAKLFFDHLSERLMAHKKQNDQVYHEAIPEADTLDLATGAELVKPVLFQPSDAKSIGKDIFSRLVPMRAYEAASVYSEEKAKLLRSVVSSVQDKDAELEQYLVSLNAEEIDQLSQAPPATPEDVLKHHSALQGKAALVKKLHSDIQELMKLSGEVSDDLLLISEQRQEDERNEEAFQGRQGQRSPSQITATLWKEADNYSTLHSQASKSNVELKAMLDHHYQFLLLLSGPMATLHAAVPKMTQSDGEGKSSRDTQRWRELMSKIDVMRSQRQDLVGQLRDAINSEDITKNLIGHLSSDREAYIQEQLEPHREIADIIRKNLEAQDNILRAVTEENAKNVQARQAAQELSQQQEAMFSSLAKAGSTFQLLQSKASEGLSFYTRIHGNVGNLRKRVLDVVANRQSERNSVERRRTPERSVSPAPQATPPPRPPKKAELAGNPLSHEQQVRSPERHVTPEPTQQTMEEQLAELQRQQTLQLVALQGVNGPQVLDPATLTSVVTPTQPHPPTPPTNTVVSTQQINVSSSDLLDLTSNDEDLRVPLVPVESVNPDTLRAIEDLQVLLQPPNQVVVGGAPEETTPTSHPQENVGPEQDDHSQQLPANEQGLPHSEPDLPEAHFADSSHHMEQNQDPPKTEVTVTTNTISRPITSPKQTPPSSITQEAIDELPGEIPSLTRSAKLEDLEPSQGEDTSPQDTLLVSQTQPPPMSEVSLEEPALELTPAVINGEDVQSTSSLPQFDNGFQSFMASPTLLPAAPTMAPELTMPLQDYTTSTPNNAHQSDSTHLENEISKKEQVIDELQAENEKQKVEISDQRMQVENYKQQLLLLQQQVSQVTSQQQKHEQEKAASSGQQAVLMQLLQQQQGMFSQQQAQLDNMSKVTEAHRREQQELEGSYKQALAVEREQKSTLQSQLGQVTQEMQRLQQQVQTQAQQYQSLQLQLHQYHTQIQERDKQLLAFREQHKKILQSLDQKHQQKVSQLSQQLQDYQAEVKKLRSQRTGVPTQQFVRPPVGVFSSGNQSPGGPQPRAQQITTGPPQQQFNSGPPQQQPPIQQRPSSGPPQQLNSGPPQQLNSGPPQQLNSGPPQQLNSGPPQQRPPSVPQQLPTGLPPPMQPIPTSGFQGNQQFRPSNQFQPGAGINQAPPTTSGPLMRQDSQPFRQEQPMVPGDGGQSTSYGFAPRHEWAGSTRPMAPGGMLPANQNAGSPGQFPGPQFSQAQQFQPPQHNKPM